jgi:undecaprenyl-diphosphatase
MNFNIQLFYALNDIIGNAAWIDALVSFVAQYYIYVLMLIVAVVWYRDIYKGSFVDFWKNTKALVASFIGAEVLTEIIRHIYTHPRPLVALGAPHLFEKTSNSFPSGHTTFMFALATAVYFFGHKKLAFMLYTSGLLIGIARVIAGVHYPYDILGGIVLGTLVGYAAHYLFGPKDKEIT